jgi:hypothetical protein
LEAAVASGGASTLQQIGAAVVRHLSPSKPRKVANEVQKNAASDGIDTSFAGMVAIGKSVEDSDKTPPPPGSVCANSDVTPPPPGSVRDNEPSGGATSTEAALDSFALKLLGI